MTLRFFCFLLFAFSVRFSKLSSQVDPCREWQSRYDSLRVAQDSEGALAAAIALSDCILVAESDTSLRYAVSLRWVGNRYDDLNLLDSATDAWEKSLDVLKAQNRELHPDYASGLYNLAIKYKDHGDYAKAEEFYLQALEIRRSVLGESHPDCAKILYNLAIDCSDQGDYERAEEFYLQALEIQKAVLGESHPDYAWSLNNLANNYSDQGDLEKAVEFHSQALEVFRAVPGESHADCAGSLNNLAIIFFAQGDFVKAEDYLLTALKIYQVSPGESHLDCAMTLNNLALNFNAIGDYERAEEYYLQALEIFREAHGESHPDCAMSLNNLAVNYSDQGNFGKAEECHLQALEIYRAELKESHSDFALNLNNLATIYSDQGDYDKAEEFYLQALEIYRAVLGALHPHYAMSLNNLAINYAEQGDYAKAEEYYLRASDIRKAELGELHPDYAASLNNLAINYSDQGDYGRSLAYRTRQFSIEKALIGEGFVGMSDRQRSLFWELKSDVVGSMVELAVDAPEVKGAGALAFDGLLFGKGLLLSSSRELDDAVLSSGDSLLMEAYQELKASRQMLIRLKAERSEDEALLGFHEERAERQQKFISRNVGAYGAMQARLEVGWRDVRSGLEKGEAAIEFGQFWDAEDSTTHHVAFVLTHGRRRPLVVPLCTERALNLKWAELSGFGSDVLYRQINKDLGTAYELIWEPLDAHLQGIETVYYSGSGLLNQFPLHALYREVGGTRQYVLDRFDMHPLSTTRLIAEGSHRREDPVEKELLALGGLDFNHIPQAQEPLEGEQELFASGRGGDLPYADVVLRGGNLDKEWPYLKGTKEEVEALQEVLGEAHWEVEAWTWSEGEEGALKRRMLSSAPSVLHFATHGYAFPNPYSASEFVGREALRTHFRVGEDPLVRTGLILSGGNHAWKGLDTLKALTGEDGVLTAAELANMDLRATELVVLSACETGLGETNGMEGTMGLFRGLKLAGVEEVVQSFWEVPDKETQELMAAFYRELATSQHPGEAFRSAQRTMRTKYPNNPALWAPFILIR